MLEKIKKDLTKAIKNENKEKRNALRIIMNAVNVYKKENNKTDNEIEDEIVYSLIRKEIKQIKNLLNFALEGHRVKMLENLGIRLSILDNYMPSQMSDDDIERAICVIATDIHIFPITNKDRGKIIPKAVSIMQGKADGRRINRIITKIIREREKREAKSHE